MEQSHKSTSFEKVSISESPYLQEIIANEKQVKLNVQKMKSKLFHLTQLEDKAINELLDFYRADSSTDERISVHRVVPDLFEAPTWITKSKKSNS